MKVWRICLTISVTITYIWTKFGTEHKYNTINTPKWPHSHKLKIQDGGGRHLAFRNNVTNSGLDTDICTKLYSKLHHDHMIKSRNRKLIWVTSSAECLEHKCVDLSDYNIYLNQIWYRTQAPHYLSTLALLSTHQPEALVTSVAEVPSLVLPCRA